jgi:hypothetical protein
MFQRLGGRLDAERFHLAARRAGEGVLVVLRRRQAELARDFGVEGRNGGRGAVIGLRGFLEAVSRIAFGDVIARPFGRSARAMRRRLAAGAAVPGIVGRRLQAGARAHAGIAAIERGIEQFRKRRPDRLNVGAVRLGFRGFSGFFGSVGFLRHAANMGPPTRHGQREPRRTLIDCIRYASCC